MPPIKRSHGFTPTGVKHASKILHYIVKRVSPESVSVFTEIFNESLRVRGYKEKKKGKEDQPLSYLYSTIDKMINIWNPKRKSKLKTINPLYFEYFEPFYPKNLNKQDMIDIACGFKKPPRLKSLIFEQAANIKQDELPKPSSIKNTSKVTNTMCYVYVATSNQEPPQLFYTIERKELKMDKYTVYPLSIAQIKKLSLVFEATSRIKNNSNIKDEEVSQLNFYFSRLVTETHIFDNEPDNKISISIEILKKVSSYCFRVASWKKDYPILCPIHTYEGEWEEMIQNLDNVNSNQCICKN